jgi:membrane-bound ClpP family serine protease
MKRSHKIAIAWIALLLILAGTILSVISGDWVTFGFDVVALISITGFLVLLLRRSPGEDDEEKN